MWLVAVVLDSPESSTGQTRPQGQGWPQIRETAASLASYTHSTHTLHTFAHACAHNCAHDCAHVHKHTCTPWAHMCTCIHMHIQKHMPLSHLHPLHSWETTVWADPQETVTWVALRRACATPLCSTDGVLPGLRGVHGPSPRAQAGVGRGLSWMGQASPRVPAPGGGPGQSGQPRAVSTESPSGCSQDPHERRARQRLHPPCDVSVKQCQCCEQGPPFHRQDAP